jgi:pyruvate dehydrogenase E2 component (dihydrolipoamide acetyltransferase)
LSESKFSSPHYYLKVSAVVDNLLLSRKKLNERVDNKISLNAFLMKFTAEALKRHPIVNSSWGGDKIIRHGSIDTALAVAVDEGLITPVVRDCGDKGILDIDSELKVLIEKTKTGTLKPEQYSNSTFTITNLGSFGIEEFTAIINPPNSAILAVGKVSKEQVFDDSHKGRVCDVMKLTLSCDHRIIDGAVGAKFLTELKDIIEYPVLGLY